MIIQIPFSVLFTLLLFLFMALNIVKRSNSKNSAKNLLPGPRRLPLIGNMHQLIGQLPHESLRNLAKKYGPFMHLQLGELSNIIVSSPELAIEVMKKHDAIFANRPYLLAASILSYDSTNISFCPYGSYWRKLRKVCTEELLSLKRVQSFKFIREKVVSNLIEKVASNEGSVINLSKLIYELSNVITSQAAFGIKSEHGQAFVSLNERATQLAAGFCIADFYPSIKALQVITGIKAKLVKLQREMDTTLNNIIKEHKESKRMNKSSPSEARENLLDVLLNLQEKNDPELTLTENNIKAVVLDMFGGGSDTSATIMQWAMSELLKNPKVLEETQAEVRRVFDKKGLVDEAALDELKYLKAVVKEALRLHPPIPLLLPRESSERCEINGYEMPAKTRVIINAWAIARDPNYWTEADKFKPERFIDNPIDYRGTDFAYIPFGAGRRLCPGITFGLFNTELPLANLLYHFDWKLPIGMKPEELDMTESFGIVLKRKQDLCLIPTCYRPRPQPQ
ncbi:Cytochrome P450 [Quillaja saponaria]|uniref:Cytochrome P450 n=1 Tax=Quillaja saponaria TaxID=32244 RepID=A0AAD7LP41_QUISA|nr:Cytochrome P450 [Quillaja saponaria]